MEENRTQKQDNSWRNAAVAAGAIGTVGLGTAATIAGIKHHKFKKFDNKVKAKWTETMDSLGAVSNPAEREKLWAETADMRKQQYKELKKHGIKF